MVNPFATFFGHEPEENLSWLYESEQAPAAPAGPENISVNEMKASTTQGYSGVEYQDYSGEKYFGGFGPTQLYAMDYWTLRARSEQLFTQNLYAKGLIRRLITNIINTGLSLEATPDESILKLSDDIVSDWSELTENRFNIWADNPHLCDYKSQSTFGQLQKQAHTEALIGGDCLVVLHQDPATKLPLVQLVKGERVQTPIDEIHLKRGHTIEEGVELDERGRHVRFFVANDDGTYISIDAKGAKTGRKIAWLIYGTEKRTETVRGECLLSLVMQSIKEIDRYRDSTQRKATINSIVAMALEKTEDKIGSKSFSAGAVRKDAATVTDGSGATRQFELAQQIPGMVVETLQSGEKLVPHSTAGTDVNYAEFEAAIIHAIAWANEVPPEILQLAFSNNYSASQAAINEFKIYLNKVRTDFGSSFLKPVYVDWLLSETLMGRIVAATLLTAWRDPSQYDVYGAWISSDWSGAIKPSTDINKQAAGYKKLVDEGWITNSRATRELTGTKFTKNLKIIARENALKIEAQKPIVEAQQEAAAAAVTAPPGTQALVAAVDDIGLAIADINEKLDEVA